MRHQSQTRDSCICCIRKLFSSQHWMGDVQIKHELDQIIILQQAYSPDCIFESLIEQTLCVSMFACQSRSDNYRLSRLGSSMQASKTLAQGRRLVKGGMKSHNLRQILRFNLFLVPTSLSEEQKLQARLQFLPVLGRDFVEME